MSPPNLTTYINLLNACTRSKSLAQANNIHKLIQHRTNPLLLHKLTSMYIACGDIAQARSLFDTIPHPSIHLWNAMIRAYSRHGPFHRVIELYHSMLHIGLPPNKFTYPFLLKACSGLLALEEGVQIHKHARAIGLDSDLYVSTSLVDMYMKCGWVDAARDVFEGMRERDVVAWNAMVAGFAVHGMYDDAVQFVTRMQRAGMSVNASTVVGILPAVGQAKALRHGRSIHCLSLRCFQETDVLVLTALLDMYAKCELFDYASRIFQGMSTKNEVTWSAMIGGYVQCDRMVEALCLFDQMMVEGAINLSATSVACILRACASLSDANGGKRLHCYIVRSGFLSDITVGNSILSFYAKVGSIDDAVGFFDEMGTKNEVTWSAMIGGYVQCDRMVEALCVFNQMMVEEAINLSATSVACILRACASLCDANGGKRLHCYIVRSGFLSDITVGNSILSFYAKVGSIDDAVGFFDEMGTKDTISYSAIISGCVQSGYAKEALVIFRKMQLCNVEPDAATMVGVLPACSQLAALQHGKCGHGATVVRGLASDTSICNALIDMYAKCGKIDHARAVFDRILKRNIVSCNTMIAGYGIHGLGKEAIRLFSSIETTRLKPDEVTFICLINACSHSGLVIEGKNWYNVMTRIYHIVPTMDHYVCMVDLLGRSGLLDEARDFIAKMSFEPDVRVWGALLGACRIHGNVEIGEEVSKIIQKKGPEGTGHIVLLSNIYTAARKFNEAAKIRNRDFAKSPGCSWVAIKGNVHAFIGGDQSHPQSSYIYQKLEDMLVEMKKLGYKADTRFALQDVEEEEKEHSLLFHSEKLAIAFGILNLRPDEPIIITKNLRVCGDCHAAIKFITLTTKRAIIVRDASRFHHFKNGICNCRDFW